MGFLLAVGLAVLSFWIGTLVSGSSRRPPLAPIIFALSIGLSQIVYVFPFHLWARHRGWKQFVRGLWTGAGAVLVTNAALWMDALMHDR
jgi:heme/copper-type cytochrome/quinol oxidase subunit 4